MPVFMTSPLRGLLLTVIFAVPATSAWAEPVTAPDRVKYLAPLPPPTVDQALECGADENPPSCSAASSETLPTSPALAVKPATLKADLSDQRYRQAYPGGYAQQQTMTETQQQARQQWLHSARQASNPEGIGEPESLFANAPFAFLDWYPNPTGISPLSHCRGSYIQPSFDFDDSALASGAEPIHVSTSYSRTLDNGLTLLEGDIYLRRGSRQARSQRAQLNHRSEIAEMSGMVQYREPGLLLLGERAELDLGNNEAVIDQAQFVVHEGHLRGSATKITRQNDGSLLINQGAYTRCPPGDESWSINGSKILLSQEKGLGEITHATLRINDFPVLYVPYLSFPIDKRRMSGLLVPTFSLTTDNGIDFSQPYYFNLAANYDDTLTFRRIDARGNMLENEFRYRNSYGQFELGLAYLPNDELQAAEDRWIVGFNHQGEPSRNWSTQVDYTSVSDSDYFEDLGTDLNLSEQSHLNQRASVTYRSRDFNFEALVHDYQTIDEADSPYRKLPALRLAGTPKLDNDWLLFDYLARFSSFDRDPSGFTGNALFNGSRLHLESTLMMRFDRPWGYIHPSLKLTHTQYELQNTSGTVDSAPSRTLPLLSFDTGLLFDRYFEYDGDAYSQTLEPRLFFLEVPFQNQDDLPTFDSSELTFGFNQLFRDNRFSGLDRIGDTSQVTAGLTTRLLDSQGYERGNASIGQIYYSRDRRVRLSSVESSITDSRSNLVAEGLWNITQKLRISADAEWDRNAAHNLVRNFKIAYRSDIDHTVNFGYRFTEDELEQTDLTMIWPLSTQWSMLGRWQQDLVGKEALDLIAGLEYENCCWQVRTIYRQWITADDDLRRKEGLFLQFVLKGLGGIGTRAAGDNGPMAKNFMKEISGFEEHKNND
tara:strand:+ start:15046 stop:17688 length:2643 start_codon:yes stop_codon:yes gene_type:complete